MRSPAASARASQRRAPLTPSSPPGRELKGHTNRSGTTVHGWPAVGVGLLATAPAIFVGLILAGGLGDPATKTDAPTWVIGACGLAFAAAGISFVVHGIRGVVRRRTAITQRRAFPMQPWQWDYDWDVRGTIDRGWEEFRRALLFGLIAAVILAPGNWAMVALTQMPVWAKGVVLLFDFMIAYALWRAAYLALRTVKYGRPRLRASRFPLHPGTTAELLLDRHGALGTVAMLEVTLRCVQERYETRGSGKNRSQVVVSYEMWADKRIVSGEPGKPLELRFDIPRDLPGCALSDRPPRYWELQVTGQAPGIDYDGTFLVPVYVKV